MTSGFWPIFFVAVLTLGGVFFYLLRVEALARRLESQTRDLELDAPASATRDEVPL